MGAAWLRLRDAHAGLVLGALPVPLDDLDVAEVGLAGAGLSAGLDSQSGRLGNYAEVTRLLPFGRFVLNTAVVAVTVTILELVTSSLAGYAFARLRFPGRDKLFLLYLGTLMIPGQVTIIPNFLVMSWLGWVDTYAALIVPAAFSAFGTFLLRQFFLSIPPELEQAARVDGCSYFGIYRRIILPLSGTGPGDAGRVRVHDPVERVPLAADRHQQGDDADAHRRAFGTSETRRRGSSTT